MTTEIREALTAVQDSIAVPRVDEVRFQALVRSERRRRTGVRLVAGLVAAVVAGVGGTLLVTGVGDADRGTDVAGPPDGPGRSAPVPVSLGGRLAVVTPDGAVVGSGVRGQEVVGAPAGGVVVVARDHHVRLVPVARSGGETTFGRPRDLAGVPVRSAHLDKQGLFLAFVDLDDTLHFREVGADTDYQSTSLDPGETVLGIDGGSYTGYSSSLGLVLHSREDGGQGGAELTRTQVDISFPADTAELADLTLAVGTSDGVELFDASPSAAPRFGGSLGGGVSSLAPRGDVVATATSSAQSSRGMSTGVWLLDAFSGEQLPVRDYDGGPALDIAWVDDDEFAVLTDADRAELWVCDATERTCGQRLVAAEGTLSLPTS